MQYNGFSLDIEADGFVQQAQNLWVLCLEDLDSGEKLKLKPFQDLQGSKRKFINWLDRYDNPHVAFHNGLGYDIFVLLFLMGIEHTVGPDTLNGQQVRFVDTFYLSMFLYPDRKRHSLEEWGNTLGDNKIDFRQRLIEVGFIEPNSPSGYEFQRYHPIMDEYCTKDTSICSLVMKELIKEWIEMYGSWDGTWSKAYACGQKSFYLMSCQELTGWKFDIPKAQALKVRIGEMMEELRAEVEPQLPPRPLKKSEEKEYTMPAKPFKMNGEYSANWEKFAAKHNAECVDADNKIWKFYGKEYKVIAHQMLDVQKPMEMANQDQMKDWFLSLGWKPTLWNYQRGPDGKPMRDPITRKLIQTSPKIQEQGKLCPNLEAMEGDLVKLVVKWLSLRNRQSVLEGWLTNEHLQYDGRIGAGRTGIAATHRQKHQVVVNVPKADPKVLLGYEFRELWICEDGYKIAAGDAAALEGRVQGHYTWKYDDGKTAEELLKGDVHSKNANAFYGNIYEEVTALYASPDFNKDDPRWKPYRNKSKNGFYAILYGAGAPKVASTLGIPEKYGEIALRAFWEANPGTAKLKENLENYWSTKGKSKWLPAIDGRILWTRKKSALLNTIFQSCGGITMDYAGCFMDKWLGGIHWDMKMRKPYYVYKGHIVKRIGYFHDELEYEAEDPVADEVSKMIENAIEKAGVYLGIKVPLAGEGKVGLNWKETH